MEQNNTFYLGIPRGGRGRVTNLNHNEVERENDCSLSIAVTREKKKDIYHNRAVRNETKKKKKLLSEYKYNEIGGKMSLQASSLSWFNDSDVEAGGS